MLHTSKIARLWHDVFWEEGVGPRSQLPLDENLNPVLILSISQIKLHNPTTHVLRRRANARNVSYTSNPTGEKYTISTFVDQTHIQKSRQRRKNRVFFKTSLPVFTHVQSRCQGSSWTNVALVLELVSTS